MLDYSPRAVESQRVYRVTLMNHLSQSNFESCYDPERVRFASYFHPPSALVL